MTRTTHEPAVRIGLIGTGRIGRVHAANIAASEDATLTWVVDPSSACAESVTRSFGGRSAPDAAVMLAADDVDAVIIASPTPTHLDLIAAALEAHLPVLCEKPIDLDPARVEAFRPLVAGAGVPVAIGFNRRFDPAFVEVRRRVGAGEIGALEQLSIVSRDPLPPPVEYLRASGGIFHDMAIHDFDTARSLVPDIVEVTATATVTFDDGARTAGDFDTAMTVLRAADGALVSIVNSRHSATGYDQRVEAFGSAGALQIRNASTSLVSRSSASAVDQRGLHPHFFLERYAASYAAELAEFVAMVRGAGSALPTYEDGWAALALADAARRSALERVAVPVDLRARAAVTPPG